MAENEKEPEGISTNALEIFNKWAEGGTYKKDLEEFFVGNLGGIDESMKTLPEQMPVPKIRFCFDEDIADYLQSAYDHAPCAMDIRLTGKDGDTKYVLNFHIAINEKREPVGNIGVSLYRVRGSGDVEICTNTGDLWKTVDPQLVQMFEPDARDEAVYDLFRAIKTLDGRPPIFYTMEFVQNTIAADEKLLALYKAVKPAARFVADQELVSAPIEGLMPVNSYRQNLIVFPAGEKLVLGCVVNFETEKPGVIDIYDTDSVEKMIEVLTIIWDPADEESEAVPKLYSGGIISAKPAS